jgi:hypothetical protein
MIKILWCAVTILAIVLVAPAAAHGQVFQHIKDTVGNTHDFSFDPSDVKNEVFDIGLILTIKSSWPAATLVDETGWRPRGLPTDAEVHWYGKSGLKSGVGA